MQKEDNMLTPNISDRLSVSQQMILDIFRIIAATSVLLGHCFSFFQCTIFKDQSIFPYLQNIGVVLFFLLSGFLTVFSLEKKNKNHQYTFRAFFQHKALRIFREYFPGLLIIAGIDYISIAINGNKYAYNQAYNIKQFVGCLFMLHNMGPESILGRFFIPFGSGRPLWTLSVEWWMYMLFGALFLFLSNKEKVSFAKIILFCIMIFMSSNYLITGRGAGLGFVFALGVLSYYCYSLIEKKASVFLFLFSCIVYVIYGMFYKEAYTIYSFIILWLIFCSALKMGENILCITKRNSILAFASKSTFMLYLIHYSIIDLIANADIIMSTQVKLFWGITISTALSFIAYYIFGEKNLIGIICKGFYKLKSQAKK